MSENTFDKIWELGIMYLPPLLMAIIILIVGFWIIKRLVKFVDQSMRKSAVSDDIIPIVTSTGSVVLKALLIFSVAGMVGIETSSFVATLAAASFAVGMALQGSLGHVASGILILIFKPFKIGDYIKAGDHEGFVYSIQLINTIITTLDDRRVIIPNGEVISDAVVNSSEIEAVRLEFFSFISYEENLERVQDMIITALSANDRILDDPKPFVGIQEFESHSIKIIIRAHCAIQDYEELYYWCTAATKKAMGENGVKVAYSEAMELGPISA